MQRSVPRGVNAKPFATLGEAQAVHLELAEQSRSIEERHSNVLASDNQDAAAELARLRRKIRTFEWRLAATGSRLPDGAQRSFAQSLLDFWASRQTDLKLLSDKFQATKRRQSRSGLSGPAPGCLLIPYDEGTGQNAAARAEEIYQGLSDEAARESAKAAFVALAHRGEQPSHSVANALSPFVEAQVLIKQGESYALSHEALHSAWPRLAEWLAQAKQQEADLDRLKASAETWASTGSSAELPRGEVIERAARYSEEDQSLADYVAAAKKQRTFEKALRWTVTIIFLSLLAYALWNGWTRPSTEVVAAARDAEVSEEIAQDEVIVDVADSASSAENVSAKGLSGWIWIGTANDPKIVGEDDGKLAVDAIKAGTRVRTVSNLKVRQDRPDDSGSNIAGKRQAGVSGGTLAIALEDSVGVDVKGTRQYWLRVKLLPTVFVQLDKDSTLPVNDIRKKLAASDFVVPQAERLPNIGRADASPPFDVRYYYEQDEPAARRVAQLVAQSIEAGPPPPPTPLVNSPLAERVKTGTIEVWLYRQ